MSQEFSKIDTIKTKIYSIRNQKVMLDRDLAGLYQVETKALNQAVKRNLDRFPSDFMFQITEEESRNLMSQIVTSSWGGARKLPYAFTEQGVAMLSGILKSKIAVEINIRIMRAFVELRHIIATQPEYVELKDRMKRIELQMEVLTSANMVDGAILERKITTMSTDILRISETLDNFQTGYLVIKRPDEGLGKG